MLLPLLAFLLKLAAAVYFCKDDQVVDSVVFQDQPRCPQRPSETGDIVNGTVYLFKPNWKRLQIPATRCQLDVVTTTTKRDCGLWICGSGGTPYTEHYNLPVLPETCRRWRDTGACGQCSQGKCQFKEINVDVYSTTVPSKVLWERVAFGVAKGTHVAKNCKYEVGKIMLKRPWKKIVSSWGTLYEDLQRGRGGTPGMHRNDEATVVWDQDIHDLNTCSYVLHSENGAFLLSRQAGSQLIIPDLQLLFTVPSNDSLKAMYADNSHYGCLDASIATDIADAKIYALPGDMIAIFVDSDVDAELQFDDVQLPLHGHMNGSAIMDRVHDYERGRVLEPRRTKRDAALAIDAQASYTTAKLAYFMNILETHAYKNAVDMAFRLCRKALQMFTIWKLQAETNPSAAVSLFLGRDVVVKKNGPKYDILSCASLSSDHYTVSPAMKQQGKCYSRPLLKINRYPGIIFQVGKNDRIISPPIYYEECSRKPGYARRFKVDDKVYRFLNYSLVASQDFVHPEGLTVLGPSVNYTVDRFFYDVKHVILYQPGEVSLSLLDGEDLLKFINQQLYIRPADAFFRRVDLPKDSSALTFFSELMRIVALVFSNVVTQSIAIIFLFVPSVFVWASLLYSACDKRPTTFQVQLPTPPPPPLSSTYQKLEELDEDVM